jgi:hypothetical protein
MLPIRLALARLHLKCQIQMAIDFEQELYMTQKATLSRLSAFKQPLMLFVNDPCSYLTFTGR